MKWTKNIATQNISFIEMEEKIFKTNEDPEKKYGNVTCKVIGFEKLASLIRDAIKNKIMIYVLADYDCDGVMSGAEWTLLLKALGCENYKIRAPRRISEGYGMSDIIVDEIIKYPMGLVIMVDNGIAAIEQTKRLQDYGWQVAILDHHLPSPKGIPDADIVIDPEAIPNSADFKHYCGAGLTYKFAEHLASLPKDDQMHIDKITEKKILSFASIATIADVVPLVDTENESYDNWLIVRRGLRTILEKDGRTIGLYALLRLTGLDTSINEENYGFKIGPIINASGRMYDDGANFAIKAMVFDEYDFSKAEELANELIENNNERKRVQSEATKRISESTGTPEHNIVVVKDDEVSEGVAGLVAGDLCNTYNIPSIMLVKTSKGFYKGSARSTSDINIKALLDKHSDLIYKYGGHTQAAGITILPEKFDEFKAALEKEVGAYIEKEKEIVYDYELPPSQAGEIMKYLKMFAPYGTGNEKPMFYISNFEIATTKYSSGYEVLGSEKKTIKLRNKYMSAINFNGGVQKVSETISGNPVESKEDALKILSSPFTFKKPHALSLIGTLSENTYYGKTSIQMIFSDVRKVGA